MPRPGPRLPLVALRLDPTEVDLEADRESLNRSEMIRQLISEALAARHKKRGKS